MIIGLTGQTGAGKSTVCLSLKEKGFFVIDCDEVSREITKEGSPVVKKLAENFGDEIVFPDGTLNRKLLAEKAFCNSEKTQLLNSITHPAIFEKIKEKISEKKEETIILDAPTLFESGADRLCDKIISVIAEDEIRKMRIIKRDDISERQASLRIGAQKSSNFFVKNSDAVIINNGDRALLRQEIERSLRIIGVE